MASLDRFVSALEPMRIRFNANHLHSRILISLDAETDPDPAVLPQCVCGPAVHLNAAPELNPSLDTRLFVTLEIKCLHFAFPYFKF